MAMDRAERIGFGTALGGHALLLGAFALGAFFTADRITKPQPISVSLVGEVADVSTAPDPVLEEPAPAESAAEPAPAEPEPTPVMKVEKTPEKPLEKPKAEDAKRAAAILAGQVAEAVADALAKPEDAADARFPLRPLLGHRNGRREQPHDEQEPARHPRRRFGCGGH